jgi:hypothetical protein
MSSPTEARPWSDAAVHKAAFALATAGPDGPRWLVDLLRSIIAGAQELGVAEPAARKIACDFGDEIVATLEAMRTDPGTLH